MMWRPVHPDRALSLSDARRQVHHAAQLATALGISYLRHEPDDSHTNLEWISALGALASNPVEGRTPIRVAVRVTNLTLLVASGDGGAIDWLPLHGKTIDDAAQWLTRRLTDHGLDASRYTLARHYEIPAHPVAAGAAFDT